MDYTEYKVTQNGTELEYGCFQVCWNYLMINFQKMKVSDLIIQNIRIEAKQ